MTKMRMNQNWLKWFSFKCDRPTWFNIKCDRLNEPKPVADQTADPTETESNKSDWNDLV